MASCYRLHIRLYPERYRPHREIVDFLMEVQKGGQRNIIGRHIEQALLAYIRAEREAMRQQIEWSISGVAANTPSAPVVRPGPTERPSRPAKSTRPPPPPDLDGWAYKDEDIPDITDSVAPPAKPSASPPATSRFSSLAHKIHRQLEGGDDEKK